MTEKPKRRPKRRPDYVEMVKRAIEAGIDVRSFSVTDNGATFTLGKGSDAADPIETADELRKLI
jgi:hypothetical protein